MKKISCRGSREAAGDSATAKTRIPIPEATATVVLFDSDRTCCVCNERGRPVQLHHIDEDPGNNTPGNLAALCFLCHEETQVEGGFARKLNAAQVTKYRDEWLARVRIRRQTADRLLATSQAGVLVPAPASPASQLPSRRDSLPDPKKVENYILTLPAALRSADERSRPKFATGTTPKMREGATDIIDVLEQILLALVRFYPPHHFGGHEPEIYVNSIVASRYTWHRALLEPNGYGTGGTIVRVLVPASIINDLQQMVRDMVRSLADHLTGFDFEAWEREWKMDLGV